MEAAGIEITERNPKSERPRTRLSDDELLRALSEADDAIDGRVTIERYDTWRTSQAREHPERVATLAAYPTIRRRFHNWGEALKQMHEWRSKQR